MCQMKLCFRETDLVGTHLIYVNGALREYNTFIAVTCRSCHTTLGHGIQFLLKTGTELVVVD